MPGQDDFAAKKAWVKRVPDRFKHFYVWDEAIASSGIDITLMVPCYNEELNVEGALDALRLAMEDLPLSWEAIVIDDASQDRTSDKVRSYMDRFPELPIYLIRNEFNQGFAFNFFHGAHLARGTYYRVVFGDDNEPAESLRLLFENTGKWDVVIPNHPNVTTKHIARRALSYAYTRIINLLSGYRLKYYNGGPIFPTGAIIRNTVETTGFGFQAEVLIKVLDEGFSYTEVSTPAHERVGGKSTALKLHNWLSVAHSIVNIFLRRARRRFFNR